MLSSIFNDRPGVPEPTDKNYEYSRATEENGEYTIVSETWVSRDGATSFSQTRYELKTVKDEAAIRKEIEAAVKIEDFETAARLKKQLTEGRTEAPKPQ